MTNRMACAAAAVLAALALFAPAAVARAADEFKLEEGFTRLDTGKDLEGWTGNLDGWSIVDGAIHLDAKKAKGNIYSKAVPAKSTVIRLQFRATPKADSGVFIYGNQLQVRDLGYRIRERRQARQWTQADLAEKCRLHRTFIGSVERGERNVSILNLRLIARVLRVSLAELLTGLG